MASPSPWVDAVNLQRGANEGPTVLITGASGLVGSELLDQFERSGAAEIVGVSRKGARRPGCEVEAWNMSEDPPPRRLRKSWDVIVNAAADTRWSLSPAEASSANVESLRALIPLASSTTHVIHISTAYAVGLRGSSESPDLGDYHNTYEWSKAHAERVARASFEPLSILRPPLIIGRRRDGRAARFAGMYTLIRGVTSGTVPALIAKPDAYFDVIPVDELAQLARKLTRSHTSGRSTITIAAGESAPKLDQALTIAVDALNRWRRNHGGQPLERPPLVAPETWNRLFLPMLREHLTRRQARMLELLRNFEPYLACTKPIDPDHSVEDVASCMESSILYWAEANPLTAARVPKPWRPRDSPRG